VAAGASAAGSSVAAGASAAGASVGATGGAPLQAAIRAITPIKLNNHTTRLFIFLLLTYANSYEKLVTHFTILRLNNSRENGILS
jgi:hypothetical protein